MLDSDKLPSYRIRDNVGAILLVLVAIVVCVLGIAGFIFAVAGMFAILGI